MRFSFNRPQRRRPAATRTGTKLANQIKTDPRVYSLQGRREGFEDYFVELNVGWRDSHDPLAATHCFGVGTLTEALKRVRAAVACGCEECEREKGQN